MPYHDYLQNASSFQNVIEGYNGTVFAYGQTGSGKTYSMQGEEKGIQRGIIPRTFEHIFEAIATTAHTKFLVHVSYLEVKLQSYLLFPYLISVTESYWRSEQR
jgi:hypothetical protein